MVDPHRDVPGTLHLEGTFAQSVEEHHILVLHLPEVKLAAFRLDIQALGYAD